MSLALNGRICCKTDAKEGVYETKFCMIIQHAGRRMKK